MKVLLEHGHALLFAYCLWLLQRCQGRGVAVTVAAETVWPTEGEIFMLWPCTEKVCQLLVCASESCI